MGVKRTKNLTKNNASPGLIAKKRSPPTATKSQPKRQHTNQSGTEDSDNDSSFDEEENSLLNETLLKGPNMSPEMKNLTEGWKQSN